jgi:hypothetical protein
MFNSLGQATWMGLVYGPTSILAGRDRVYVWRFGDAPFQRLYSGQNYFNPLWAPYLVLCHLLPALLNPYLLAMPVVGLAALAGIYVGRGVRVARCERLRPIWRLGPWWTCCILLAGTLGIGLGKDGADGSSHHLLGGFRNQGEGVPHKMHRAPLPRGSL